MTVTLADIELGLMRDRQRLAPEVAVALMLRVLELLEEWHAHGPRGSLSPVQVWVDGEGRVALAPPTPEADLRYVSPEHARGAPIDARSDLYVVGVMLWELITGQPFLVASSAGEAQALARSPRPSLPPSRIAPEVPASLDGALLALLAPEADHRPKTAIEARHRLAAALPEALRITWAELGSLADPQPLGPSARVAESVHAMGDPVTAGEPAAALPGARASLPAPGAHRDAKLIALFAAASVLMASVLAFVVASL